MLESSYVVVLKSDEIQNGYLFNEDGYYFSDKIVQSNIATEPILGSRSLC